MQHEGVIIRPPSQADSILLQVTVGCSHNACAFCGAYAGKRFRIKDERTVFQDVEFAARHMAGQRRMFLCDGDALAAPQAFLERVLERVRMRLPGVGRIAAYASAKSLRGKSRDDLRRLRALGLSMLHLGLESGDDELLARMGKGADVADMLAQADKARSAGMRLSATVITGLAGTLGWERHARLTGEALSAMAPEHAAALTLMVVPGTPLGEDLAAGRFTLQGGPAMVRELRLILEHTTLQNGLFLADHASNHVPLTLRLPRDKDRGLAILDAALEGRTALKPERGRRL